jgi:hypothetical protein
MTSADLYHPKETASPQRSSWVSHGAQSSDRDAPRQFDPRVQQIVDQRRRLASLLNSGFRAVNAVAFHRPPGASSAIRNLAGTSTTGDSWREIPFRPGTGCWTEGSSCYQSRAGFQNPANRPVSANAVSRSRFANSQIPGAADVCKRNRKNWLRPL